MFSHTTLGRFQHKLSPKGSASPLPTPSILFLPLPSKQLSEWNQESKSLCATLKATPTSASQTEGPTCQVKCGLEDDGRAPLPLAYAAVDPGIARPDLGQQ